MVSASIVTHDTHPGELALALECLKRSGVARIYVIDNSRSDSLRTVAECDPRIIYRHVENRGFGAGHNIALRETVSRSRYHIVMNADVSWEGDVVNPMARYMDGHKDVGLMGPRVVYPDGMLQYTCRLLPSPTDVIFKRFLPKTLISNQMDRYLLATHDHTRPIESRYLMGCFMMFRTEALKDCGFFDERFFMYPEDIDISRRIAAKWKTLYWPRVEITHRHDASSRHNLRMLAIHIVNMIRYFNKWGWRDKERKSLNSHLPGFSYVSREKREAGRG